MELFQPLTGQLTITSSLDYGSIQSTDYRFKLHSLFYFDKIQKWKFSNGFCFNQRERKNWKLETYKIHSEILLKPIESMKIDKNLHSEERLFGSGRTCNVNNFLNVQHRVRVNVLIYFHWVNCFWSSFALLYVSFYLPHMKF